MRMSAPVSFDRQRVGATGEPVIYQERGRGSVSEAYCIAIACALMPVPYIHIHKLIVLIRFRVFGDSASWFALHFGMTT